MAQNTRTYPYKSKLDNTPESREPIQRPIIRIQRAVHIDWGREASDSAGGLPGEWHNYLASFQQENRQVGATSTLGGLALTYVSDQMMVRLMKDKYPKLFDGPFDKRSKVGDLLDLQADLRSSFTKQVRSWHENGIVAPFEDFGLPHYQIDYKLDEIRNPFDDEVFGEIDDDVCTQKQKDEALKVTGSLWSTGGFLTNYWSYVGKGNRKIAIDLSRNPELYAEYSVIKGWLRDKGFNVCLLEQEGCIGEKIEDIEDVDFYPHLAFFRYFEQTVKNKKIKPRSSDKNKMPSEVGLSKPKISDNHYVVKACLAGRT